MKMGRIGTGLLVGALAVGGVNLRAADMTLEGKVSDAECKGKHPGGADGVADCTNACVARGVSYALVVGPMVYTLKTSSDQQKSALAKLAGKMAKVTGDVTGANMTVKTVATGTATSGAAPKK